MTRRSPPCGDTSPAPGRRPTPSISRALCQLIETAVAVRPGRFRSIELADPQPRRAARRLAGRSDAAAETPSLGRLIRAMPKSPEVERFLLLDRPAVLARPGLTAMEIPLVEAEVLVGKDTVFLEAVR